MCQKIQRALSDEKFFLLETIISHGVWSVNISRKFKISIDLCLSLFCWAKYRKTKAAIKMHTLMDLRGNIPTIVHVTDGVKYPFF